MTVVGLSGHAPLSMTASIATRMLSTQLSESNTRNTSTPFFAACCTKKRTTLSL